MIHSEKQGLKHLLKISLPYIIFSTLYTAAILVMEEYFGDHIYKISGQIGSVFGLAVAFFLGFRMNSAYDRWWEARKIFANLPITQEVLLQKYMCITGIAKT
jgi:putative membrane protein